MQTRARTVHHNLRDLRSYVMIFVLLRCTAVRSQEAFDSLARTAHGLADADALVGAANPWKRGTVTEADGSKACVVS